MLRRAPADVEALGDLRIRAPRRQQRQDLGLPLGQRPVALWPCPPAGAELAQQAGRRVDVAGRADALEGPKCETRLGDRCLGSCRSDGPGQLELCPPRLERQVQVRESPQGGLEMEGRPLVSLGGVHAPGGQVGKRGGAVIPGAGRELGQPLERLRGGRDVAAGQPDLHEKLQGRCAGGIRRRLTLEAQTDEVLCQSDLAAP